MTPDQLTRLRNSPIAECVEAAAEIDRLTAALDAANDDALKEPTMIIPYSDELAADAADVLAQIDGAVSKPRLGVSGRMTHAELSELLPIDTNWGDPLTPDIALHIVYAAIAKESEK